jgi:deoxyribonuclease V
MDPSGYEHLSPVEAIAYQNELRQKIQINELQKPIKTIAGADISFNKDSELLYAGIVVFKYPDMQVIATSTAISHTSFPYISGSACV